MMDHPNQRVFGCNDIGIKLQHGTLAYLDDPDIE